MISMVVRGALTVLMFTLLVMAGPVTVSSRTDVVSKDRRAAARLQARPLSYRSPGGPHKLVVPRDEDSLVRSLLATGAARRVSQYPSYTLLEVSGQMLGSLDAATLERGRLQDDMNLVMLKAGIIDTTGPEPRVPDQLRQLDTAGHTLRLVQFAGPPTNDWLRELRSTGADVLFYVPNHTYLVRASGDQMERVRSLQRRGLLQWEGPFHPAYKLDPRLKLDSTTPVSVAIALVNSRDWVEVASRIRSMANQVLMPESIAAGAVRIRVSLDPERLLEIVHLPDVISVEPWSAPRLLDERASQIVAGVLSEETINSVRVSRPTSPGFLTFLNASGLNSQFDFAIDMADTGLDRGSATSSALHPDFRDPAGNSRVAYLYDYTSDALLHPDDSSIQPAHDTIGHGTVNASIAVGYSVSGDIESRDSLGFQYGMGVAPFAQLGISKLFDDRGRFAQGFSFGQLVASAYVGGARVSSNSWGICEDASGFCNLYSDDCTIYDALVRDADPYALGNQEMIVVFSSGNEGNQVQGSVNIPGTAKNVITVGASEGFRATDAGGNDLRDGCGVGPSLADNAADVPDFSSSGPVQDGRAKPDLVAPGTHVTGAATQDPAYATRADEELGTCDRYFPSGQSLYTWASGTSEAAPIVAGAAALAFQWLRDRLGSDPSPALVKALLLNSASYLTGRNGGDSLPGAHQGWGLLNLTRTFEPLDRIIYDQSPSRMFTASGAGPFELTGTVADPSKEFRAMLVWTDAPGAGFSNAPYVNQLNLEVEVGGVVYSGNNFAGQYSKLGRQTDFLNNVQGVRLPPGTIGPFVVRVWPTVIAGDGVPGNGIDLDQDFALVITNGREGPVPLLAVDNSGSVSGGVTVTHQDGASDTWLVPGETAGITVRVSNTSQTAQAVIRSATLAIPGGASAVASYPTIGAGAWQQNTPPFQVRVPADLLCGSVPEWQLRLVTTAGPVSLPVRLRVGRQAEPGAVTLLEDDVDSASVRWKAKKGFSVATGVGTSGTRSYHAVDPAKPDGEDDQLSTLTLKKKISIPEDAGEARLTFFHIFNFEPGFDGGVLEISTDAGATWEDLGSRVIVGGYDGKLTSASDNPLGNRFAWTSRGKPGVFSQVVINLDDFVGKKVKLRFLAGFDAATGVREGYSGWFIDDIRITTKRFTGCN